MALNALWYGTRITCKFGVFHRQGNFVVAAFSQGITYTFEDSAMRWLDVTSWTTKTNKQTKPPKNTIDSSLKAHAGNRLPSNGRDSSEKEQRQRDRNDNYSNNDNNISSNNDTKINQ